MLKTWLSRISTALDPRTAVSILDIERVGAMLLVEIARADHVVHPAERQAIIDALEQSGKLDTAELHTIVDEAFAGAEMTTSLYDHIRLINEQLDKPRKLVLVEQMWRVALADGKIDGYEENTIRKLCDLLYIKHRDFIQAKLRVMEG